jgi:hypothetical protein
MPSTYIPPEMMPEMSFRTSTAQSQGAPAAASQAPGEDPW